VPVLVGYARVSTEDQNPDLQRRALKEAGCKKVFEEKASGAQRDRPQLTAALDYMREGDTLVVWKLDRLARSLKQLIETIETFDERGTHLLSLTEKIDTSTPSGRLVFHVFGALAEFERGLIRERTLAGLASARARGRVGGRPKSLSETTLRAAKAMLQAGEMTVTEIAQQLDVSPSTLYRYLPAARSNAQ
jgi:DNA invertase Pin-like site-specific DNA recombinase